MTEQERIEKVKQEIAKILQEYNVRLQPKIVQVSGTIIVSLTEIEIVGN